MLASGVSGVETAKAIGVKASTVSEWQNHCPQFIHELDALRDAGTRQAVKQLRGTLSLAVEEVQRIITTSPSDALRLRASVFVIETCGMTVLQDSPASSESKADNSMFDKVLKDLGKCQDAEYT